MLGNEENEFFVSFTDEMGRENNFEILAVLEFEGRDYAVMLPEEGSPSENGMLYIFEVAEELDADTDTYLGVDDQRVIDGVYELFLREAEKLG
ncbi:MAG: DUF1292 domain-containing protein [Clostridia bacterium]|nr:DUF1292 domain-containing protein [Clostridia bacterium]MBR5410376.1 DUF1292 domain-containing protein [Clostridia bacterium]